MSFSHVAHAAILKTYRRTDRRCACWRTCWRIWTWTWKQCSKYL